MVRPRASRAERLRKAEGARAFFARFRALVDNGWLGKLKPLELRVLLVYMRHADNYSGEAYLGVKNTLTAEVGSTNTARVLRAVKDLEARGILAEVEKGGRAGGRNMATVRRIVLPARRPPRSP